MLVKRMETIDDEFAEDACAAWMEKQAKAGKPFSVTLLDADAHLHAPQEGERGQTGRGDQGLDSMVQSMAATSNCFSKLDDLYLDHHYDANRCVRQRRAEMMSWPDGGSTPYRGEKATNWEEARLSRSDAHSLAGHLIKPGTIFNEFFAHEDLLPVPAPPAVKSC